MIGVIARSKPIKRATKGPKDYYTSFRIIDSSRPTGLTVSVFRPRKEALPVVDVGDCVLLRDFKVGWMPSRDAEMLSKILTYRTDRLCLRVTALLRSPRILLPL